MKLKDCKIGDKVKVIGGLADGCNSADIYEATGYVITKEMCDYTSKCQIGWVPEWHETEFVGFIESKYKIYVTNNCDVELIEKANTKNEKENIMKNFKIKEYKVYNDKAYNDKALKVTFEDGTEITAVCDEEDTFDLMRGIEVCAMKYVFGSEYNKVASEAHKQIKAIDKAEEIRKEEEARIARKKEKNAKRKAEREAKRKEREKAMKEKEREDRIAEMKEAYIAALKECGMEYDCECDCNCELCESDDLK